MPTETYEIESRTHQEKSVLPHSSLHQRIVPSPPHFCSQIIILFMERVQQDDVCLFHSSNFWSPQNDDGEEENNEKCCRESSAPSESKKRHSFLDQRFDCWIHSPISSSGLPLSLSISWLSFHSLLTLSLCGNWYTNLVSFYTESFPSSNWW